MPHILLIESDRILANTVASYFVAKGHSLDWQVTPQDAINSADSKKPDIVILDLLLAGRSGIEFLYEFRSYPDWVSLPVVVLSNLSEQELGDSFANLDQLGVVAYHHKHGASLSDLSSVVDKFILAKAK